MVSIDMINLFKGYFLNDFNNLKYSKELGFWVSVFYKVRVLDFGFLFIYYVINI